MGEDQAAGTGPFDTEGGAEWAADLRESGNLALLIEEALGQATEEREWVEAYDGERALAAAEVIQHLGARPQTSLRALAQQSGMAV